MSNAIITAYPFEWLWEDTPLSNRYRLEIARFAKSYWRESVGEHGGYLRDEVDYDSFLSSNNVSEGQRKFGQITVAREVVDGPIVGMVVILHNHFLTPGKRKKKHHELTFPFLYCHSVFPHDVPYLEDLDVLGAFAYGFQFIVPKKFRDLGYHEEILDFVEQYYFDHNDQLPEGVETLLFGASIHDSQESVIELISKRNKHPYRPEWAPEQSDFSFLWLDHFFDGNEENGHWFRVVQIPSQRRYLEVVNSNTLPIAFTTIVPIQLTQATRQLNLILKPLGAEVLYSSFFHDHKILKEKYKMDYESYGFFSSLLPDPHKSYQRNLAELKDVIRYLREKRSAPDEVVDLRSAFRKKRAELFFFNKGEHRMPSFTNPYKVNLAHEASSMDSFIIFLKDQGLVDSEDGDFNLARWKAYHDLHLDMYRVDRDAGEEEDYWWCHAAVPFSFVGNHEALGVLFSFRCKTDLGRTMTNPMDSIAQIISLALSRDLLSNLTKLQESDGLERDLRYGTAAVTTRNMAHHLGSHILAKFNSVDAIKSYSNLPTVNIFSELARFNDYLKTKSLFGNFIR